MNQAADVGAPSQAKPAVEPSKDEFDFFQLPRPIQDRFLASVTGSGAPRVMLFQPASAVKGLGAILVFVLSASIVCGLAVVGYGDLRSAFSLQGGVLLPIYGSFGGLAAVALAAYAWARSAQNRYPYRFGAYLFPAGVLVADKERLRWFRIGELVEVQTKGGRVKLRFPATSFSFPMPRTISAAQLEKAIDESKAKYASAFEQKDRRALAALDPLRDSGFSNPLSSHKALPPPRDQRPWRYTLALLLGGTIGVLTFFARNKVSEAEMYQAAVTANSAEAYEAYLARGGNRPGVVDIYLPRARLSAIKGDTAAVEQFSKEHPDSPIRGEIDLAMREVLLKELAKVREQGTLAALNRFLREHPENRMVEPEVAAARHAVYDAAYADFKKAYAPTEEVQGLFRAMIAFSEKHGPEVQLRFRRQLSSSAKVTDNALRRSAYFAGSSSLPSQYFEAEHAKPREDAAAEALAGALQKAFPQEVLQFVAGPPLEGEAELPQVDKPTLFVTYRTTLSGGYTTNRPRNVYVGIGLTMSADFVVPGEKEARFEMKYSKWLPPDVNEISRDNLKPEDVYDKNARKGFEQFQEKLMAALLPEQADG